MSIIQFQVGNLYNMRSIGDHNCIWECLVIKRTAKQVTLKIKGYVEPVTKGVKIYEGSEQCAPLGVYSMHPVLRADKPNPS